MFMSIQDFGVLLKVVKSETVLKLAHSSDERGYDSELSCHVGSLV